MRRFNFIILVMILAISTIFINSAYAVYEEYTQPVEEEQLSYAPGQIIIKLKENVEFNIQREGTNSFVLSTNAPELNSLNDKYITSAKLVFGSLMREDPATGEITILSSREQAEIIKQKFPQRTARTPQNKVVPKLENWLLIDLKEGIRVEEALLTYQSNPHIEYAQPNYIVKIDMISNDTYYFMAGFPYNFLYGMHIIDTKGAWDITQGSSNVIVAVIDTGLDYSHEDIQGNVWINNDPINGIDDDNNGYVDDYRGWSFAYNNNDVMDRHGHGSHTAGTIAAKGNNNIGVVGVSWNAKIMVVKGLGDTGAGLTTNLANGIYYAANNGADILSNSWGPSEPRPSDPVAEAAVLYAYNLGCIVVFSAGNDNVNVMNYSPNNMEEVITVASSDYYDHRSDFSNWGDAIDVTAPGEFIISLDAGGGYCSMSGTSMACPHVSGLVALLLSRYPTLNFEEIREVITSTADDIEDSGWDQYSGYGRINAYQALLHHAIHVPQDYPTIQTAINAADDGDIIIVSAGTYTENITMKSFVTVIGEDRETTILTTNWIYTPLVAIENINDCNLSGFSLLGTYPNVNGVAINNSQNVTVYDNIFYGRQLFIDDNTSAVIRNNIFRNIYPTAIATDTSNGSFNIEINIKNNIIESNFKAIAIDIAQNSNISIVNNVIYDNDSFGIEMRNISDDSFLTVKNNIITENYEGIYIGNTPAPQIVYNISYNNVWGNDTNYSGSPIWPPGFGNISADPVFLNPTKGDFYLGLEIIPSPCVDSGDPSSADRDIDGSRNNMGAFGGPYGEIYRVVPTWYPGIQGAIEEASPRDTIIVLPGEYSTSNIWGPIVVHKDLIIKSVEGPESTAIQGGPTTYNNNPVFIMRPGLSRKTHLEGFTLQPATNVTQFCGVKIEDDARPVISNNIIKQGTSLLGQYYGIMAWGGAALINNNIITGFNKGIYINYCVDELEINNNTITENTSGICIDDDFAPQIKNCIIYNNTAHNIFTFYGSPTAVVSYSDIEGGYVGEGNINQEPYFVNPENGDYHLQEGSPCIDSGNPSYIYNDPDGTPNDMGAYGGPEAVIPEPHIIITYPREGQPVPTQAPTITWDTTDIGPDDNLRLKISHIQGVAKPYSSLKSIYQKCLTMIVGFFDVKPAYAAAERSISGTVIDLDVIVPNTGSYIVPPDILYPNIYYTLELSLESEPNIKDIVHFQTAGGT